MSKSKLKQRHNQASPVIAAGVANDPVDLQGLYKKHAGDQLVMATEVARIIRKNPEEAALDVSKILTRLATLEEEVTRLHKLSRTDVLTKLFNRHHITDELGNYCSVHPGEEHRQNTHDKNHLLMIDLDKFKPINDNHGHLAGDEALQKVAGMLTHHTRKTDVVARLGGDEFLILLKDITDEDAEKKVLEIQTAFNSLSLSWAGKEIELRGSVGHCKVDPHLSAKDNIDRVDKKMYAEKKTRKTGRDFQP